MGRRRAGTCREPAGGHAPLRGDGREEGCLAPQTSVQLHSGLVHTARREKLDMIAGRARTGADIQAADPADISHLTPRLKQHRWEHQDLGTPEIGGNPDLDLHSKRCRQLPCSPGEERNGLSHDKSLRMKVMYVFKERFH